MINIFIGVVLAMIIAMLTYAKIQNSNALAMKFAVIARIKYASTLVFDCSIIKFVGFLVEENVAALYVFVCFIGWRNYFF